MTWPTDMSGLGGYPPAIKVAYMKSRQRAYGLRQWAALFLVLVVATLGAGFWGIVQAPELARLDKEAALSEPVRKSILEKKAGLVQLDKQLQGLTKRTQILRDRIIVDAISPGTIWTTDKDLNKANLTDIAIAPDGRRAITVGDSGTVAVSADGSESWSVRQSGTGNPLTDIAIAPDGRRAIAVGWNGTIITSKAWGGVLPALPDRIDALDEALRSGNLERPIDDVAVFYREEARNLARQTATTETEKTKSVQDIAVLEATAGLRTQTFMEGLLQGNVGGLTTSFNRLQIGSGTETNGANGRADIVKEALAGEQTALERGENTARLTTTAVRIGVVAIVLLLVQIFVSLSRYNMRLAGFYDARADAILYLNPKELPLGLEKVGALETLMATLSPDAVDFGKAPKGMMDQAIQLARNVTRPGGGSG